MGWTLLYGLTIHLNQLIQISRMSTADTPRLVDELLPQLKLLIEAHTTDTMSQEFLDKHLNYAEGYVIQLKAFRNEKLYIHRLPSELLCRIFVQIASEPQQHGAHPNNCNSPMSSWQAPPLIYSSQYLPGSTASRRRNWTSTGDEQSSPTSYASASWIDLVSITHVCRAWTTAALECPQFWSFPRYSDSRSCETMLSRSQQALLTVRLNLTLLNLNSLFGRPNWQYTVTQIDDVPPQLFQLLSPTRLKNLHVFAADASTLNQLIQHLCCVGPEAFSLVRLDLSTMDPGPRFSYRFSYTENAQHLPLPLRIFLLPNHSFAILSSPAAASRSPKSTQHPFPFLPFPSNLLSLSIISPTTAPSTTFLLEVPRLSPELEELALVDACGDNKSGSSTASDSLEYDVALLSLRSLQVLHVRNASAFARLYHQLSIPSLLADLDISVLDKDTGNTLISPDLEQLASILIDFGDCRLRIELSSMSSHYLVITLERKQFRFDAHMELELFFQTARFPHLRELELASWTNYQPQTRSVPCQR